MMIGLARLMDQTRGMVYALLLARNLISVEITYLDWNAFFFCYSSKHVYCLDDPGFNSEFDRCALVL